MPNQSTIPVRHFSFCDREWQFPRERPILIGILNLTPDSFSDGGRFERPESALAQARAMIEAGAGIIDIGGESTRPGAMEVPEEEEKKRVLPIIQALAGETDIPLSIDTRKAAVATAAIQAGASIINDISGLHHDPQMLEVLRQTRAGCIVMHMRGTPATMQNFTDYQDLIHETGQYFRQILDRATQAGVASERFILDPGLGFSKNLEQNLQLLARFNEFAPLGRPLLIGPSRKSFIGRLLNCSDPLDRGWGTAATVAAATLLGADLIRVHEVRAMTEVATVAAAIRKQMKN